MLIKGGLALHKAARMIAVSSNTHKILVFAFALDSDLPILTRDETEYAKCKDDGFPFLLGDTFKCDMSTRILECEPGVYKDTHAALPSIIDRRRHNVVICLVGFGHETNIPNIAFWNPEAVSERTKLGEDNSRIFLTSTDIDGTVFVWDVWSAERVFKMAATDINFSSEGGWSITCLDPSYAQVVADLEACYGTDIVQRHLGDEIVDNSACVDSIEDNSKFHPAFAKFPTVPVNPPHGITPPTQMDISWNPDNMPLEVSVSMEDYDEGEEDYEEEEEEEEEISDEEDEDEADGKQMFLLFWAAAQAQRSKVASKLAFSYWNFDRR